MAYTQRAWPVFDVLYVFLDVAQALCGSPSAHAVSVASSSTQRDLARAGNRVVVNETQWHAVGNRICALATASTYSTWWRTLLISHEQGAPPMVRPFYSIAFYSLKQTRVEMSYISRDLSDRGVWAQAVSPLFGSVSRQVRTAFPTHRLRIRHPQFHVLERRIANGQAVSAHIVSVHVLRQQCARGSAFRQALKTHIPRNSAIMYARRGRNRLVRRGGSHKVPRVRGKEGMAFIRRYIDEFWVSVVDKHNRIL